jgi:hypothetical protein
MTNLEFQQLADRGALIQWIRSGKVEYLYRTRRTKIICAANLITKNWNRIPDRYPEYHCTEIPPEGFVRFGQLI